jgi:eukaryotic-like serine/threonine-protein kinase
MSESLVGQMIGNVRLEGILGEGAVGSVYRGHHTTLGIDVAVKILKVERHQVNDTYYYERFRREAQITARLTHPNLVKVRDFGQYNSLPYIVMEYVDGCAMDEYLRQRKGPLPEQTILKVLMSISAALSVAHTAGIIHRDLKPANILISQKGQLKVADLGLARSQDMPALTMEQMMVGSPGYMSPERLVAGGQVDHRSDIYALGVIGYQLVFGTMPYNGDIVQVIHGHLSGQAAFDLPTHCRPETVQLIQKMMAYDANVRHQSAEEIVAHIRALLAGKSVEVTSVAARTSLSQAINTANPDRGVVADTAIADAPEPKASVNGADSRVAAPSTPVTPAPENHSAQPHAVPPTRPLESWTPPTTVSTGTGPTRQRGLLWVLGLGVLLIAVAARWYFSH